MNMLKKRKLSLRPERIEQRDELRQIVRIGADARSGGGRA
jgi:hypothetical protein